MDDKKKNSLLIVDDENANLKVLTHILGSEYTILTASNGLSAIEKAKEYKPDLILLDILMPEMDGFQTLYEIKNIEEIRRIPVIFITGLDSDKDEEKGLALDAADYIIKPFNAAIVKLRVRNQIQISNHLNTIGRLKMVDQLTDIPNRRSFEERLKTECEKAINEQKPISLLIMGIDKFREINETYGYKHGDFILNTVVKFFTRDLRYPVDFTARWSGDEFAVLIPDTKIENAMGIAGKLRSDIENAEIHCDPGFSVKITVSIGVNSVIPDGKSSIDTFISNTDKAFFAAKKAGGNTVMQAVVQ